jgi:hypothetical protein
LQTWPLDEKGFETYCLNLRYDLTLLYLSWVFKLYMSVVLSFAYLLFIYLFIDLICILIFFIYFTIEFWVML